MSRSDRGGRASGRGGLPRDGGDVAKRQRGAAPPAEEAEADGGGRSTRSEREPEALDPSLVGTVLALAARHGDATLWDAFLGRMKAASSPEAHDHFMYALGDFRDPALIQKSLALATSGTIRRQDVAGFLGHLLDNRDAAAPTWAFVTSRWQDVLAHSTAQSLAWRFLPSLGSLCTQQSRTDAAAFFAAHPVEAGARPLAEALESIDLCIRLKTLHAGELGKWLAAHRHAARTTVAR